MLEVAGTLGAIVAFLLLCWFLGGVMAKIEQGMGATERDERISREKNPKKLLHWAEQGWGRIWPDGEAMANNPRTPPAALVLLADSSCEWRARLAVAERKDAPPEALRLLLIDPDHRIRAAAQREKG